ncbi:hypothetical protein HanPSC8_Chr17g0763801 [Helianthus annuus]|nr:hypothetical protein HanPSC8_Chr17g0763801 [Helianthus annuus]
MFTWFSLVGCYFLSVFPSLRISSSSFLVIARVLLAYLNPVSTCFFPFNPP